MNEIWLEIFGYIGTGLVVASMMMTSIGLLRILNVSGSVISAIYSAICGAWPIVVMNISLILINLFHLIRERLARRGKGGDTSAPSDDAAGAVSLEANANPCKEISLNKE